LIGKTDQIDTLNKIKKEKNLTSVCLYSSIKGRKVETFLLYYINNIKK